ncbi:MAG: FAD-binding oxidoreductase [Alphaproteobacteria bacterium]|nr:FAD-binding oxidoreductase [Alphaproteobacteria bacterium]
MLGQADVVVVGGGIVGAATAYYLAKAGAKVTLVEKGEIAGEQSSRNWGFVRQQGRDPFEVPLAIESVRMWEGLEAELGADLEWRQGGGLAVAGTEAGMAAYERWLDVARQYQMPTRLIGNREVRDLMRGAEGSWPGAMYTPTDGQAEPAKVAPAFAAAARARGATITTGCAVDAIQTAGGAVTGVATERGEIRARTVVCAAGAWSSRLLGGVGVAMPQLAIRGTVSRTSPVRELTPAGVWAPELAFRQRRDGTLNIVDGGAFDYDLVPATARWARDFMPLWKLFGGNVRLGVGAPLLAGLLGMVHPHPFRATRVLNPPPQPLRIGNALAGLRRVFPDVGDVTVTRSWAGFIDMTPDMIPVIGPLDSPSGLVVASGFSGHGFMLGPIAGRLASEIVLRGQASLDVAPFRLARFRDGTSMGPRPLI